MKYQQKDARSPREKNKIKQKRTDPKEKADFMKDIFFCI